MRYDWRILATNV